MGFCTSRKLLLTICILQLFALCERQVFEFLGFLWIPILLNFLEIIFVIFGFFGAYQYRPKYIASYLIWHILWLAWNIYIICLYLDIGVLDHKQSGVIKIDQWSESWWVKNGPGCRVELNVTHPHPSLENVVNCYVDYRYVEIFQAGLQTTLALLGLITGFCLSRTFLEEDDSFDYVGDKNPCPRQLQPMYVEKRVPPFCALTPLTARRDPFVDGDALADDDDFNRYYCSAATTRVHHQPVMRMQSFKGYERTSYN